MTPSKCPGCGTKLEPDMLACPNCPMSFPEDEGGDVSATNPLKQSKYWQFVFPVLFFGAIGAVIWYIGSGLMHLGEQNNSVETPNFLKTNAPSTPPSDSTPQSQASGDAKPSEETAKDADDAGSVSIVHTDDDNGSGSAARPDTSKAPAPVEVIKEWKLRGKVYDLTTLKPLAGVQITFADEATNRTIRTRTDAGGSYRAIVPPLEGRGYAVAVTRNGYSGNYLDPGTEGVQEKDAAERKGMARDLASTLAESPATIQSASSKPLVTDFYLAPRP